MSDNKKKELGQELDNVAGGKMTIEGKTYKVLDNATGAILTESKDYNKANTMEFQQGLRNNTLDKANKS